MKIENFITLNNFYKKKFGTKVYKIPVSANFECPNRDGTLSKKGCIFCNNNAFSGVRFPNLPIDEQVKRSIEIIKIKRKIKKFVVYFQPNTNTYTNNYKKLSEIYELSLKHEDVVGISIGTRPDYINDNIIDILDNISKRTYVSVELGAQSFNDETLRFLNRNHTVQDIFNSIELLKKIENLDICLHIILGIQTDNINKTKDFARIINDLDVQGVKIHHFHIVKNTELEKLFYNKKIFLLTYDQYIYYLYSFINLLSEKTVIHRIIGDAPKDLLIAPVYNKNKNEIVKDLLRLDK